MASRKKSKQADRWFEIAGIVMTGFALYAMLCLVTYNSSDPSWTMAQTDLPETFHNLAGSCGAILADLLFQVFGFGAFVLPMGLVLLSLKLFVRPSFHVTFFIRMVCYFVLFLCAETLLGLVFVERQFPGYAFSAGGLVGYNLLAQPLGTLIGNVGAYLLIAIVGLIIVMGLTRISYVGLWQKYSGVLLGHAQGFLSKVFHQSASFVKKCKPAMRWPRRRANQATIPTPAFAQGHATTDEPTAPGEIPIKLTRDTPVHDSWTQKDLEFEPLQKPSATDYVLPGLSLLDDPSESSIRIDRDALRRNADLLTEKLADFGVKGRVVEINPGPLITRFEFQPTAGIKLNRIVGLSDDLALALKALSVRIAPIPGKSVVGIELPNKKPKKVFFKEIVSREDFREAASKLTFGLGKDIAGGPILSDLARMPHLLVAGTTGSGKSVFINTVICSILLSATPDEVRFLMIDPKRLELFPYDGIPHLLHPVVIDPKKAAVALRWVVEEMERRYKLIAEKGTRNIIQYNQKLADEFSEGKISKEEAARMTYIVVVIDELADLMMIAKRDVEGYIARLAQMARASGIHLLIATQRPSVDILTGVIKANFPSRISFQVSSKVDSRTILDSMGAEKLLGMGDMLFMPPGTSRLQRIHGAYISEKEIYRIAEFIKQQQQPDYDESIVAVREEDLEADEEEYDELYDKAVALVADTSQASISMLQRKMRVGYNRAARMIERMEKEGVVGPSDGVKPRDVLVNRL